MDPQAVVRALSEIAETASETLRSWSPRLRPRPEPIPRIDDAQVELDPSCPLDAASASSSSAA